MIQVYNSLTFKKEEFKTNSEFKNKFLDSKDSNYTINISTFTTLDNLEDFGIDELEKMHRTDELEALS